MVPLRATGILFDRSSALGKRRNDLDGAAAVANDSLVVLSMVREQSSNPLGQVRHSTYHTLAGVIHIVSPPCSMKHGPFEIFHPLEMDLADAIS